MPSGPFRVRFSPAKAACWLAAAALVYCVRRAGAPLLRPALEPVHVVVLTAIVCIAVVGIARLYRDRP